MPRNPNCKERLDPVNPVARNTGPQGTGRAALDGYTVTARRPRAGGMYDDMVETAHADRIEGIVSSLDTNLYD